MSPKNSNIWVIKFSIQENYVKTIDLNLFIIIESHKLTQTNLKWKLLKTSSF